MFTWPTKNFQANYTGVVDSEHVGCQSSSRRVEYLSAKPSFIGRVTNYIPEIINAAPRAHDGKVRIDEELNSAKKLSELTKAAFLF